jgi:hypothetical protein
MKSPADMKIIQIDITNACTKRCSNCTRYCGHHRKPFMMDFETFKRAVDSLKSYAGMVGIMGGEPTLHPEFEKFVRYFASQIGPSQALDHARRPITSFAEHVVTDVFDINHHNQRGLFSSLGKKYYENFELIQEVFGYQGVNDHASPSEHASLLLTRKELGIPDAEWFKMRDDCWIQNIWSATITPKGAFFCEVAGALDVTFDGPGGWAIEPGWWKRKPADFAEQLEYCEMCSACLKVPSRDANEEIDDVSPVMHDKLVQIGSPKLKQNLVKVVDFSKRGGDLPGRIMGRAVDSSTWYLPDSDQMLRVGPTNRSIYPKRFDAIVTCGAELSPIERFLARSRSQFDDVALIVPTLSPELEGLTRDHKVAVVAVSEHQSFGAALNTGLASIGFSDWVLKMDVSVALSDALIARLREVILNPGCCYFYSAQSAGFGAALDLAHNDRPLFVLFNRMAQSLRDHLQSPFDPSGRLDSFQAYWPERKRVLLSPNFDQPVAASEPDLLDRVFGCLKRTHASVAAALPRPVGDGLARFGRKAKRIARRVQSRLHGKTS